MKMETMTAKTIKRQYNEGEGLEVAFYDSGKIIGQASTVFYKGKPNNFLHGLEVREECRRQGYGAAIVEYMIEKYDVQYLYVSKSNEVAINLYKKSGFKEVGDFGEYFVMFREAEKG